MHTFKNTSRDTPIGVNTKEGRTVYVAPGQTSGPLDVADGELAFIKEAGQLEVSKAKAGDADEEEAPMGIEDGSVENSTAHREGNPVRPAAAAPGGPISPNTVQGVDFDAMNEDELRSYLTNRDGRAPHPNTKLETLREKAKAGEEAI